MILSKIRQKINPNKHEENEGIVEEELDLIPRKKSTKDTLVLVVIIILITTASYGLGRLSKIDSLREPVVIEGGGEVLSSVSTDEEEKQELRTTNYELRTGQVVVSKNGTKYHLPWCPGVKQMKESNKVWFNSIEEARSAGYGPAGNCKGLK